MTPFAKKNRIIFIDLMRAIAVIQMIQGHTVDTFLADNFRTMNSSIFSLWYFMRGMTAPIFMFSAGTVFAYLLRLQNIPFKTNPRVKKGIKRFFLLVFLGYLLRYPTAKILDFSNVTPDQWKTFFTVDVLHLIGFGILFILILAYFSEKLKMNDYVIFGSAALIVFLISPFTEKINWVGFLPYQIAGYFYAGTGSLFPLIPWSGFVISGAVLGSYLANHPAVFKTKEFSYKLFLFGASFMVLAQVFNFIEIPIGGDAGWSSAIYLIFFRLGFVLTLNAVVAFICLKVDSIPRLIILLGRNTLLIYVVHLVLLYGSAWSPGLDQLFNRNLDLWTTLGSAGVMIMAMTFMVILINKFKLRTKQLVAAS
jgi:uncharacterized membrane protein